MSFAEQFLGPRGSEGFTREMLLGFLRRSVEEGLNLEYKHIGAIDHPDDLAKVVTAFANSEGGLLILGVDEAKDQDPRGHVVRVRPGEITWGSIGLTREKLESLLITRVHPWIPGLLIHPIRSASNEVVFLVDVPQSARPPHQAPDRKYYLRYNFQNLPMDHHQVAALFLKRLRPDLRPSLELMEVRKEGRELSIRVGLLNEGGALAKWPIFFGELQNCREIKESTKRFFVRIDSEVMEGRRKHTLYSSSPLDVVHPRMIIYLGTFHVALDGPLSASIMVGAEDMPTKNFLFGVSPGYLRKIDLEDVALPLSLIAMSPEDEFKDEVFDGFLRQVGMDPATFRELLRKIAQASSPEDVQAILGEMDELARRLPEEGDSV
jgi:hypothetical protein